MEGREGRIWSSDNDEDENSSSSGNGDEEEPSKAKEFWDYLVGMMFDDKDKEKEEGKSKGEGGEGEGENGSRNGEGGDGNQGMRSDKMLPHPCDLVPGDFHYWLVTFYIIILPLKNETTLSKN